MCLFEFCQVGTRIKIKGVGLTASGFAFGELLDRAPSNQGLVLLVWPLLRRGSFTPVLLRGPAPNGHPCPDGALAASMRLDPLRKTCVQPAPKSRFAVSGIFADEEQKQSNSRANAEQMRSKCGAKASRLKPVPRGVRGAVSGTGFSREEAGVGAIKFGANTINVGVSLLTKTAFRTLKVWSCSRPAWAAHQVLQA